MTEKLSINDIVRDFNAKAEAEGMLLKQDPWAMPEIYSGSVLDPPTPEGVARTAKLRQERLARADATKRASEQVQEAPNKIIASIQEQCLNVIVNETQPTLPTK